MIKYLFEILSNLYCNFFTKYENIFFKKEIVNNELQNQGYIKLDNQLNKSINYSESSLYEVNKYLKKIILSEDRITQILSEIFLKTNLMDHITNITGFKYSIDYLTAYETCFILTEDRTLGWYANKLHKDKPFSKNTLKLIIPLENINDKDGPMEILNKKLSKNNPEFIKFSEEKFFKFKGSNLDIFIFKPNICFHFAGIPSENSIRKQIMIQLNPAKQWEYNNKIYKLQKFREPKFPFFSYMFDKKVKLK